MTPGAISGANLLQHSPSPKDLHHFRQGMLRASTRRGKAGAALSIPAPRSGHREKGWRTTVQGWDGQRRRKKALFFLKFAKTK